MHTSGDAALLAAWEAGRRQSPPARALSLLASTGVESATLANWPLGRRDSALLDLRAARFGPRITGLTHCPACGDRLELDFAVDDIRTACAGDDAEECIVETDEGRFRLALRPLRTADLLAVAAQPQEAALLARAVVRVDSDGEPHALATLPPAVVAAAASRLAALDPQADVRLALRCAACAHEWTAPFDVGAFLWEEVDAWARRLLVEVHLLASAYGWREADILALSAARRRAYLELVMA